MRGRTGWWLVVPLGLALAAPPADAQVIGGSGELSGRGALRVQRCGRDRGALALTLVLDAAGGWSAVDGNGTPFAGTWVARAATGRALDLAFDEATLGHFTATLVEDAAVLCETTVVLASVTQRRFRLRLNRRRTRATLQLRYRLTGTAAGRQGTAGYRLVARGPWQSG